MKHYRMAERTDPEPEDDAKPKVKPKTDSAFDVWLQRGLHKLYDDVANEPVPDALLRLIEEDRAKMTFAPSQQDSARQCSGLSHQLRAE